VTKALKLIIANLPSINKVHHVLTENTIFIDQRGQSSLVQFEGKGHVHQVEINIVELQLLQRQVKETLYVTRSVAKVGQLKISI